MAIKLASDYSAAGIKVRRYVECTEKQQLLNYLFLAKIYFKNGNATKAFADKQELRFLSPEGITGCFPSGRKSDLR